MPSDLKLNAEQTAQIEQWAQTFLLLEPQDRLAGIETILLEYAKAVRTAYPDLTEQKLRSAVMRLGDLIVERFRSSLMEQCFRVMEPPSRAVN